ncbi:MAG TPA: nuclear transport factor 2 family protein [Gemmatimonadales bacterium]|jgi:ketosteroid isomerase-like protein
MAKRPHLILVLLALSALACRRPAATNPAADSLAVVAASRQYVEAWIRGDTASALGLVSKDIRILISGVPDIVGPEATRKVFVDEMATYRVPTLNLNRQDLFVNGDYAIDIGTYEEIQVPKTGAPIHGTGRYMTMWCREAGEWRIVRYMLNDLPK